MTVYSTGTITVSAGGTAVTGSGTNWLASGIRAGDLFFANGLALVIAAVNSNTSLTLANAWPGGAIAGGAYFVQLLDDNVRTLVAVNALLAQLNGGNLTALAALSGAADKLPYFSGVGAMALADLTPAARGLLDDTSVAAMLTTLGAAPSSRATVGGTANAVALTSPVALATGAKLRFRAASQNTGAATIALNGGTAVACRTITGVALPAGYIRTDADTEAVYDGTYWVLGREIERGSGANGEYTKFADGMMICTHRLTAAALAIATAYFGGFRSAAANVWTYPAAFTAVPRVTAAIVNGTAFGAILGTISATTADWYPTAVTSQAGVDRTVDLLAVGRWF